MRKLTVSLRDPDSAHDSSSSSDSSGSEDESEAQSQSEENLHVPGGSREALVILAKARCCLSCGHRCAQSAGLSCAGCGVSMRRNCPSCGALMLNGASLCLGCMEIDNAFLGQPKACDDLALTTT